jgi:hypothetical protein
MPVNLKINGPFDWLSMVVKMLLCQFEPSYGSKTATKRRARPQNRHETPGAAPKPPRNAMRPPNRHGTPGAAPKPPRNAGRGPKTATERHAPPKTAPKPPKTGPSTAVVEVAGQGIETTIPSAPNLVEPR